MTGMTCRDCGSSGHALKHDNRSHLFDHEWVCEGCGQNWRGHDENRVCTTR